MQEFDAQDPMSDELVEQTLFDKDVDYIFEIRSVSERVKTVKSFYRTFEFRTVIDGVDAILSQNLFPFQMIPLAGVLGITPKDKKVSINWNNVINDGLCIVAKVKYKEYSYKKDGETKTGKGAELCDVRSTEVGLDAAAKDVDEEQIPF